MFKCLDMYKLIWAICDVFFVVFFGMSTCLYAFLRHFIFFFFFCFKPFFIFVCFRVDFFPLVRFQGTRFSKESRS